MGNLLDYKYLVNPKTEQDTYHLCNKTKTYDNVLDEIEIRSEKSIRFLQNYLNEVVGKNLIDISAIDEYKLLELLKDYKSYLRLFLASLQSSRKRDICGNCVRKLYKY